MNIYNQILEQSRNIDWSEKNILEPLSIVFPVPKSHPRSKIFSTYPLILTQISNVHFLDADLILCDENIKSRLTEQIATFPNILFFSCTEKSLKTVSYADAFLKKHEGRAWSRIFAIGGGVLINFGGYIAEKLNVDLVYVPTSIIAMSDASLGGKVRLNSVENNRFNKHAYKAFYEPSAVILDPQFLEYLINKHIRVGFAEIIKHALYQSPKLSDYLLSGAFDPFRDRRSLLRAVLWTADLKRVCLEIDPEESKDGSHKILRAAHDISDKLEEQSQFILPHGEAVERAMVEYLHWDPERFNLLTRIYQKFGIEYARLL